MLAAVLDDAQNRNPTKAQFTMRRSLQYDSSRKLDNVPVPEEQESAYQEDSPEEQESDCQEDFECQYSI